MSILRVFPRRTNATPDDELVRIGEGPGLIDLSMAEDGKFNEVHISVSFTYDEPLAQELAKEWGRYFKVLIGGPGMGTKGEEFIPGRYLKRGMVITSRGCPNKCWFCVVPKREGDLKELEIKDGFNICDDNLLACSDGHIKNVFAMLERQDEYPRFTGGLEAKRLEDWHALEMRRIKTKTAFFAYDTADDYEPLVNAGKVMLSAGFTRESKTLRCFVLCGYINDTIDKAEARMLQTMEAGFVPQAMLYRDKDGNRSDEWMHWARKWARPALTKVAMSGEYV